ncbi:jg18697 [Pararge aegeria aegeria]|uniref:Syndecan n=1 Tax=Pararge aegeria aegeria TaxID=348720 RepID=A0A8S4SEB7_9NEOP|nr:jg18697 [Pararge aegeria aegeria]
MLGIKVPESVILTTVWQEGAAAVVRPTEGALHQQDDPLASDKDNLFIDDDGSGLEIDESSGSGWGPGPGPDDEDGRAGSGDAPDAPPDDEDFKPRLQTPSKPNLEYNESDIDSNETETQFNESETNPIPNTELPLPIPVDSFDVVSPVIGGAVVGLLCAILVVMFIVYRMRKKDEGSYALDEPKRSPAAASYGKGHNNREFYA